MKPPLTLIFYWVLTGLLVACAIVIVLKLLFIPTCAPADIHATSCAVEGWSIAGLAATVLGVAAAILAILGAFAVAYWWGDLDKRVGKQVSDLYDKQKAEMDTKVMALLEEQKIIIGGRMDSMLKLQQKKIEDQEQRIEASHRELKAMDEQIDVIIDLAFDIASINPPWAIEERAQEIMDKFKSVIPAYYVVHGYLEYARKLTLPIPTNKFFLTRSIAESAGLPTDPLYYWQKASEWADIVEKYYQSVASEEVTFSPEGKITFEVSKPLQQVRDAMNTYRPIIEEWQKNHPEK